MLLVEPALLSLFGTTPGKQIMGLHMTFMDGNKPSYYVAWQRTLGVIVSGIGFGIPFYTYFPLFKSYSRCAAKEEMVWDRGFVYTIKDRKKCRIVILAAMNCLVFCLFFITVLSAFMPRYHGDISKKKFVKNYTYLEKFIYGNENSDFFDDEQDKWHLDYDGKWTYIENIETDEENLETHFFEVPRADFRIDEKNGVITSIYFEKEYRNNESWLEDYNRQMILSMMSYVGAQKGMNMVRYFKSEFMKQFSSDNSSFMFTETGITVEGDIISQGYVFSEGIAVPNEDAETYLKISLRMYKENLE